MCVCVTSLLQNTFVLFMSGKTEDRERERERSFFYVQTAVTAGSCAECDPATQTLFGPFQRAKVQTQSDNTSSQPTELLNPVPALCSVGTGIRLSLMQMVREIRLPVSVVVNGSHRSPPLTVDRKGRKRTRTRSQPFQTVRFNPSPCRWRIIQTRDAAIS